MWFIYEPNFISKNAETKIAVVCELEHETSGRGVAATHSNADFAQDLLWNFACFLQWLVQRATIL